MSDRRGQILEAAARVMALTDITNELDVAGFPVGQATLLVITQVTIAPFAKTVLE